MKRPRVSYYEGRAQRNPPKRKTVHNFGQARLDAYRLVDFLKRYKGYWHSISRDGRSQKALKLATRLFPKNIWVKRYGNLLDPQAKWEK